MNAVHGRIKDFAKGRKAVIWKHKTSNLQYKKYSYESEMLDASMGMRGVFFWQQR